MCKNCALEDFRFGSSAVQWKKPSIDYRQNMNSMLVEEAQKSYIDVVLVSVKDSRKLKCKRNS